MAAWTPCGCSFVAPSVRLGWQCPNASSPRLEHSFVAPSVRLGWQG
jgi:hypothetical protein